MKAIAGTNANMSVQDTNVLKGLAILLLLCHHLFGIQNGLFDDILLGNHYLVNEIGKMAKVCVTIFVFLSGYGLIIQTEKKGGLEALKEWYAHRFKKLFLNYWFVWIVFVPISYFCFDMTFQNAYQTNIIWHLLADIMGIHSLVFKDIYCYNPTWWFYSCIIVLYLLFPVMYKLMKQDALTLLLLTLIISFLPIPFIDVIKFNIVAFALGMWMANSKIAPPSSVKWLVLILFLLYVVDRNINSYPLMIDCILTVLIVQLYRSIKWPDVVIRIMAFLGMHSMNIFLFHVFIIWWFKDAIYITRNPIIILFTLLFVCVPISLLLEYIKKLTIYRIV